KIEVTNYGQTPAVDVSYAMCVGIEAQPLPDYIKCDTEERWTSAIGAGQKVDLRVERMNPLKEDELRQITAEDFRFREEKDKAGVDVHLRPKMFLYGQVHSRDVFGISHKTEFCGAYVADSEFFVSCGRHNSME